MRIAGVSTARDPDAAPCHLQIPRLSNLSSLDSAFFQVSSSPPTQHPFRCAHPECHDQNVADAPWVQVGWVVARRRIGVLRLAAHCALWRGRPSRHATRAQDPTRSRNRCRQPQERECVVGAAAFAGLVAQHLCCGRPLGAVDSSKEQGSGSDGVFDVCPGSLWFYPSWEKLTNTMLQTHHRSLRLPRPDHRVCACRPLRLA